jgi:hypothetical protein
MRIVVVEDDSHQAEFIADGLAEEFGCPIKVIPDELEFRRQFAELENDPPSVLVIDVFLRWTSPRPGMALPPDDALRHEDAGFRCQQLLAGSTATRDVPVILYTVFHSSHHSAEIVELPRGVSYLVKDSELTPLFQEIRRLIGAGPWSGGLDPAR